MSKSSLPILVPNAVMIVLISSDPSILSKRAFSTFRILPLSGRIAWNFRSRPMLGGAAGAVALDQEELGEFGIPLRTVGELAGQIRGVEDALPAGELARFAGGLAGARRLDAFLDDAAGDRRMLLEVGAELVVHHLLYPALDLGGDQAILGLGRELRVVDAHRNDRRQALADVVARERDLLQLLREPRVLRVGVDRPRERRLESFEVRAAVAVVDRVGERVDLLAVAVVPLQRDLAALLRSGVFLDLLEVDRLRVEGALVLVQVLDERGDAAGIFEVGRLVGALVLQVDLDAFVEEGLLAQALGERVEAELEHREDLVVGMKRTFVPVFFVFPIAAIGASGLPRRKVWNQTWPSRLISSSSSTERAFTTDTPTPCSPPETL